MGQFCQNEKYVRRYFNGAISTYIIYALIAPLKYLHSGKIGPSLARHYTLAALIQKHWMTLIAQQKQKPIPMYIHIRQ